MRILELRHRERVLSAATALLVSLLLLVPILAACQSRQPDVRQKGSEPVKGGTVVYGAAADAKSLNPILISDANSRTVSNLIFEGLVATDAKTGAPKPMLAESWSVSDEGLRYTFKIRDGVKWHDGTPVTSEDARFTYETILDPKTKTVRRSLYDQVKSFSTPDKNTLVVELKGSFCPFLITGMSMPIVPKHILEKSTDINTDDFNSNAPVGTGPFIFNEWVKDDHITLTANENYWGGPPNIDAFIYKVVKDVNVIAAQLKTGDLDAGEFTSQPQLVSEMKSTQELNVYDFPALEYTSLGYNMARPFLQDTRVRQALTMALDRDKMLSTILDKQGEPMLSHIPMTSWAYDPDLPRFPYDPSQAAQLLEKAGYKKSSDGLLRDKDGNQIKLTLYTSSGNKVREGVATVAREQFKEIGIDLTVQLEQFTALVDRMNKSKDFDMVVIGWSLGADPDSKSVWHSSQRGDGGLNVINYVNPEVDKLLDEGRTLPGCDQGSRKEIYSKFQKILAEDQPYNFLFAPRILYGVSSRLQGVNPSPWSGMFWNLNEWYSDTGK
ncbi:MAG: hypothetical protein EXR50_04005 [Dehalococcoidia bacterium]|nr:hypothetical protein [Dehalococcoidia bacterium]